MSRLFSGTSSAATTRRWATWALCAVDKDSESSPTCELVDAVPLGVCQHSPRCLHSSETGLAVAPSTPSCQVIAAPLAV